MATVEMKQSRINYAETGSGEYVVLIHCSSASGSEWNSLCESLGDRFRCIVPDQWNCGGSDPWPGTGPFTLADEAAPIVEIIDGLRAPVHLVGHSYGGGVALRVARERPGMIRSLTLVEPSVFHLLRGAGPAEQKLYGEISGVAEAVKRGVDTGDLWSGMARFVDYWNGDGAWNAMPIDARLKLSQRLGKVALDFRALFDEPSYLDDYASLRVPTLILYGGCSPGPSRRIVEMLHDAMPNVRVERIEGAGHMSPLTHPAAVNDAIGQHLQTVAGQGYRADTGSFLDILTPREREILALLRAGHTNARIGWKLGICEKTVRNHVSQLYEKLHVHSRGEAIALAYEHGVRA